MSKRQINVQADKLVKARGLRSAREHAYNMANLTRNADWLKLFNILAERKA